jgi:hypothetical protein
MLALVQRHRSHFSRRFIVMKRLSLVLVVFLVVASPSFAQDLSRAQIQQLVKIEPVTAKSQEVSSRPSYLLPPQGQPAESNAKQSSGTSHKKRNIIIATVVGLAVGGVIVAAHNGAYGMSNSASGSGY